jgi:hypothetical protein
VSRGGASRLSGSSVALLTRRGSAPARPGRSPPSPGKGYGLVTSLKSRGTREGLIDLHRSRIQGHTGVGLSLSAPSRG